MVTWLEEANRMLEFRCSITLRWTYLYRIRSCFKQSNTSLVFCTSMPLTSYWWFWSTIKLCPVHSLSSALSINLSNIKFLKEIIENAEKQTQGCWARSMSAIHCAVWLPYSSLVLSLVTLTDVRRAYQHLKFYSIYVQRLKWLRGFLSFLKITRALLRF